MLLLKDTVTSAVLHLSLASIKLQLGRALATLHLILFSIALDSQDVSKVSRAGGIAVGAWTLQHAEAHSCSNVTVNIAGVAKMQTRS